MNIKKGMSEKNKFIIILVVVLLVGILIGWCLPRRGGVPKYLSKNLVSRPTNNLRGLVTAVDKQSLKFSVKQPSNGQVATIIKTAEIDLATGIYSVSPRVASSTPDAYQEKLTDIRNQLKLAVQAKDAKRVTLLKDQLNAIAIAKSTDKNAQARALSEKLKSLPIGSLERQEAELAFLELTSAFKYTKITLAEIKSGETVQVWAKDDISTKDSFVATRIEIRR
jgi:hypothetical protein